MVATQGGLSSYSAGTPAGETIDVVGKRWTDRDNDHGTIDWPRAA